MQTPIALHRCLYKALCGCDSEVYPLVDTFIDCEINSEILKGKNMSMISEMVVRLRKLADQWRQNDVAGCNLIDDAANTIEDLSAKVRNNNLYGGWIPTSEELPSSDVAVMVTYKDGEVGFCYFDEEFGYWETSEERIMVDKEYVLAWMPMPKPYDK